MYDYSLDYDRIKLLLDTADFSNEQLDTLIGALQNRRGKSAQLTHEEKVLLQCCREHRSYAHKQEIDTNVCPHCHSVKTIKFGTRNGRQRYICKDCRKTFGDTNGTPVYRSKLSANKWIDFLIMTFQGESVRSISRNLHINKETVLRNRYRVCSIIWESINKDDFKSIAQADEFYYPLSHKDIKNPKFFLEVLGRMPYTHRSLTQKYEYLEKQGYPKELLDFLQKAENSRKEELEQYVDESALKSQERFSNAVNQMDNGKVIQVLQTLNEQQKKKRGISNQQICILTCVDEHNNQFLLPVCVGRIWSKHIEQNLIPHFTENTQLVTDSHSAYKSVANKYNVPLRQIPSGKHRSNGFNLGKVNGYHRNLSDFLYSYHGISAKYINYYLAFFYWKEKNKDLTYEEQAYEIMTLLANQVKKVLLKNFKENEISFDLKGVLNGGQGVAVSI